MEPHAGTVQQFTRIKPNQSTALLQRAEGH
jgi:hypothetical protein